MSRIGNTPVEIPDKVEISQTEDLVKIKGPEGENEIEKIEGISVEQEDGRLIVKRDEDTDFMKSCHGLTRSLLEDGVRGVVEHFEKRLRIEGVGYRASVKGDTLNLEVGYSHTVEFPIPDRIDIEVEDKTIIKVTGSNKQQVGQVAASIRQVREPEPYQGTGIRYVGEHIRRKVGKTAVGV